MTARTRCVFLMLAVGLAAGCAHSPPEDPWDPLEPVNRQVYAFNDTLDYYALSPVARTYRDVTPRPVRRGIGNALGNLKVPVTAANDGFQGKVHHALSGGARFLINSTMGIGGLFDVAADLGLPERDEDFGQTLGVWGVGQGAYLMLPLLGPSTGRDLSGNVVDWFLDPTNHIDETATQLTLQVLYLMDLRASLLGFEQTVRNAFDPYAFVRTAYLQNREAKVADGEPRREVPGN